MFPGLKFTLNSSDPSLVTPASCYYKMLFRNWHNSSTYDFLFHFPIGGLRLMCSFWFVCCCRINTYVEPPPVSPRFCVRFVSLKIESTFVHVNPTFRYFIGVPLGVKLPPVYFSYTRFYKSSHNKYQLFYCVTNSRALILLNWKQHTLCRC